MPAGRQDPLLEVEVLRADGKSYCVVRWLPGGVWTGTCPGFVNRRNCKHVDKIRVRMGSSDVNVSGDLL